MPTRERPEPDAGSMPVPPPELPDRWAELRAIHDEAMRRADEIYEAKLRGEGPEWWRI
jgi:hypothetical protein